MEEAKPEPARFRPRLGLLLPVVLSLCVTGVLGYPLINPMLQPTPVTPFQGDTISGASANALFFVLALGVTATGMLFLVRRGRMKVLRRLVQVAVVVVCSTVALWYTTVVYSISGVALDEPTASWLLLILSIAAAAAL